MLIHDPIIFHLEGMEMDELPIPSPKAEAELMDFEY